MASYLPSGIIAIVIRRQFMGVGSSLKMVVNQGNDLMHMMQAPEDGQRLNGPDRLRDHRFVLAVLIFMLAAFVLVAAAASQ